MRSRIYNCGSEFPSLPPTQQMLKDEVLELIVRQ